MSSFDVRFDITDTVTPGLSALVAAGSDLTPEMAEISEAMFDHTRDRFQHEYGPDGVPWEPSKRAIEEGGRTLYQRGDLFNAIDRDSGADYAQVGVIATGGPAVYARTHQKGATIKPKPGSGKRALRTPFGPRRSVTIPARPFLGIEVRDRTIAEQVILDRLERAAAA